MAFNTKYQVPDFDLSSLIQSYYGYELDPAPQSSWYTRCPLHNHTPNGEKCFRVYDHEDRWGGWVCPRGEKGNTWDFLSQAEGLPGPEDADFDVTVEFVCEHLGLEPRLKGDYEESPADRASKLMKDIAGSLRPVSFEKPNEHWQKTQGQFLYRGISPMTWMKYGVGMLPESEVNRISGQYSDPDFEAAGIPTFGRDGYKWLSQGVVVIRPSAHGVPKGLAVRRYPQMAGGKLSGAKYVKNSASSELLDTSSYVFGLDGLTADPGVVWVVEGEFDALSMRVRGLPNVLTYGSGTPADGQVDVLETAGDQIWYVADHDENGAGYAHAGSLAEKLGHDIEIIFPGGDGDPEEFVRANGVEALEECRRYSGLQVQMIGEDLYDWSEGRWSARRRVLAKRYMEKIVENPSVFDDRNVAMVSYLSGVPEEDLRSWLYYERNMRAARAQGDQPFRFQ